MGHYSSAPALIPMDLNKMPSITADQVMTDISCEEFSIGRSLQARSSGNKGPDDFQSLDHREWQAQAHLSNPSFHQTHQV